MLKITIPVPCHEDWNKMSPAETGRHCTACAKTVVDFTVMSDDEVKNYLLSRQEEKLCGRFKQSQLHRVTIELPQNIFSINMPLWKKFLAACLIVFSTTLFSCDTTMNGKPVVKEKISQSANEQCKKTGDESRGYVGGLMFRYDSVMTVFEEPKVTVGITFPEIIADTTIENTLVGDIELSPVEINSADTSKVTKEIILTGDTILTVLPARKLKTDSSLKITKTKNPPKADSIDCNTIKNYY